MIDQVKDTRRQEEARQEDKKNDQILHNLLLQVILPPKPNDTPDTLAGITNLCTTISLIDQNLIEERANQQAKTIILVKRFNCYTLDNQLEIKGAHPKRVEKIQQKHSVDQTI